MDFENIYILRGNYMLDNFLVTFTVLIYFLNSYEIFLINLYSKRK